jgi:hypothetical protein
LFGRLVTLNKRIRLPSKTRPIRCFTLHFVPFRAPLSTFIISTALCILLPYKQDVGGSGASLPTRFFNNLQVMVVPSKGALLFERQFGTAASV